jgi:hypothetical protein
MYGQFFGEFLLQKKRVTRLQLEGALRIQQERNKPIGVMAMDFGLLSASQVGAILEEQLVTDEPFGRIAVRLGALSEESLRTLLSQQSEEHLLIGQALTGTECLSLGELEVLLDEFRRQNAQEERRIRDRLEDHPGGRLLVQLAVPVQRRLSRAIAGMVKVEDVLSEWKGPALAKTIAISLSRQDGSLIECGLHLPGAVVLPFVYCLLQRETWSKRFIDEALVQFGRSLAYAVSAELARAGSLAATEEVHVQGPDTPGPASLILRLHSGIGPLIFSFRVRAQSETGG